MDRIAIEKHLKQNKEIIRINQIQSNRIASLEAEITKLISENIQLRTQVIQLTHRQDLTNQKAQIERKLRELHRMVKSLGSSSGSVAPSPLPPIIKKSPKKANLLQISPEHSPERARIDFVSTRSRPRSLAAPSRAIRAAETEPVVLDQGEVVGRLAEACNDDHGAQPSSSALPENIERRRDSRERDRERELRRSSRRISRTSEEMVAVPFHHVADHIASGSPRSEQTNTAMRSQDEVRVARRRSRSSMNFEPLQLFPQNSEHDQGSTKRSSRAYSTSDDDKENAPSERRSTASIKLLHSSPVKSRTALNLIADPLPSHNIQASLPTPTKPLKEVQEVKSEPVSPSLENEARQDLHAMQGTEEMAGRSRRGKTVNYAEPSLRHKMRRTESLPGDKRRKSTYRRSSSTMLEDRRSSSSFSTAAQQAITIEED